MLTKERLIALESELKEKRKSLITSIDSVQNIFNNIRKSVLNSKNPTQIACYVDSVPKLKSYQSLRGDVDKYNVKARQLNGSKEVNLYVDTIQILKTIKTQEGLFTYGNEMFKYDYYEYRINSTKELIVNQQEKVKTDKLAQEKRQKESAERKKVLLAKYGSAYTRYDKEGYYTGMSFDLVKDVTPVLLSKGFIDGINYYEGPFKLKFGFKNNKLVYFSGYLN